MEDKVSKKAQKVLVIFLLLMLVCMGISRGMASLTTPKVKVAGLDSQELAYVTSDYATVEKGEKDSLQITLAVPADSDAMRQGDTIEIFNLSTYQSEKLEVEEMKEEDGMYTTTIPLSKDMYEEGQQLGCTINHNIGSYFTCVPVDALHTNGTRNYVLVLEEKETVLGTEYVARQVNVTVEAQDASYVAVKGELTSEDQIITGSNKNVEKGDVVRLAEEE